MKIDHVVLWVDDPEASLAFYTDTLGMTPVRAEEYSRGEAPFPSARINEGTIIDLMKKTMVEATGRLTGGAAGGQPLNHVCLAMSAEEYAAASERLTATGVSLRPGPAQSFGAKGITPHSVYFEDPDGNIIEIRHY